ncbi:MAG TPA: hypothetical protein VGS16_09125 [Candidatus Dormibacteraeota bacterium]|jgi:hypothetical protein|nr:hypothetical protein [Candidatus Dormibacteraeota bacterium]
MQAQATYNGGRMSVGVFVAVIAILVTFLVGGASGYLVKALTVPAQTSAPGFITTQSTDQQPLPQRTILPNRT